MFAQHFYAKYTCNKKEQNKILFSFLQLVRENSQLLLLSFPLLPWLPPSVRGVAPILAMIVNEGMKPLYKGGYDHVT